MVHSEVYLNKYVVHLPALAAFKIYRKLLFFTCFRFFYFSSIFPGGQLIQFAPMCGRP